MAANWEHYNVHWKIGERKGKVTITALSKEDAKDTVLKVAKVENNSYKAPFELKESEITRVIKLGHIQTPKQRLAGQYRSCLGALGMAAFNCGHIILVDPVKEPKEYQKQLLLFNAIKKNIANSKRDLRELFIRLGLNIHPRG